MPVAYCSSLCTPMSRLPDHANLNASDAVEMSKCKAPNKVWQVDEVFERVLVDAQQALAFVLAGDSQSFS